uniref:Uncharacterized protein n=1 Tax=Thermosporothrix sp. COM3 TaxID=2490863 RepID=A0A455SU12_9CHLR|nr:hypothetical protein KTC_51430 [Thermosporothrix sp. COM3]
MRSGTDPDLILHHFYACECDAAEIAASVRRNVLPDSRGTAYASARLRANPRFSKHELQ